MPTSTDVKKALMVLEQPERVPFAARFCKTKPGQYGEGDQFLGLSMPQQHAVAKRFSALGAEDVVRLVQDPYHECRMTGLLIWVNQSRRAGPAIRTELAEQYVANRQYVNNWDLVDCTCPAILGEPLLNADRSILYELAGQDHLWSQRIAIISTVAFIRQGQFADTFTTAEGLLTHRHDLIHKAVGWMLREVGKRNSDALEEFLHDNVRQMPRTALRYAIEKFDPGKRTYYLKL